MTAKGVDGLKRHKKFGNIDSNNVPTFGEVESVDTKETPHLIYVVFEGVVRKGGKRRIAFTVEDLQNES